MTVDLVSERLRAHGRGGTAADLGFAQLTEDTALHAPAQEFRVLTAEDGERPQVTGGADDAVAAAFRDAAAAHQADVMQEGPAGPGCDSLALPGAAQNLLGLLDPRTTVPARIGARLRVPEGVWDKPDPLEPIMAAPEFPQPMYEPLRDMSQDWLLPGLDRVPPEHVSRARDERALHRVLHGRAEPRDGARAALARLPDRPARHLLPAVLGPERRGARAGDGRRARGAQGHRRDPHLAGGEAARRRPRARQVEGGAARPADPRASC